MLVLLSRWLRGDRVSKRNYLYQLELHCQHRVDSEDQHSGVLAGCKDAAGYPLTVDLSTVTPAGSLNVVADANGGFLATVPAAGGYTFTFKPVNSQGTQGSNAATATLTFPAGSGLAVTVLDGADKRTRSRTIVGSLRKTAPSTSTRSAPRIPPPRAAPGRRRSRSELRNELPHQQHAAHRHRLHRSNSCEVGQTLQAAVRGLRCGQRRLPTGSQADLQCSIPPGVSRSDQALLHLGVCRATRQIRLMRDTQARPIAPSRAAAGSAATAWVALRSAPGRQAVTIYTQPSPYPTAKLTVFVFEDDFPLNGEHDAGGGIDVLSPNEPGLGWLRYHAV